MSSDRLATLLRQRQLLSTHLAWLDAEIAEASGLSPSTPPPASTPLPPPPPPSPPPARPGPEQAGTAPAGSLREADPEALARANALADSLLKDYAARNTDTPQSARRSCLMLTLAVGLLAVAGFMGIYLIYYR